MGFSMVWREEKLGKQGRKEKEGRGAKKKRWDEKVVRKGRRRS